MTPTDEVAIRDLVAAQFASLDWGEGREADWATFIAGFLEGAPVVPAARPARLRTVLSFAERMQGMAATGVLTSFSERPLGIRVSGYGNVAVALAACEMTENGQKVTRDVSGFLLVREERGWRIAAQGWDAEKAECPLPECLPNLT